jgi:hypothetical protein
VRLPPDSQRPPAAALIAFQLDFLRNGRNEPAATILNVCPRLDPHHGSITFNFRRSDLQPYPGTSNELATLVSFCHRLRHGRILRAAQMAGQRSRACLDGIGDGACASLQLRAEPGSGPIPPAERVELLDAMRGLAILGIFVINLHAFSEWSSISASEQAGLPTAAVDPAVFLLMTLLAQGKLFSLFSLLFGNRRGRSDPAARGGPHDDRAVWWEDDPSDWGLVRVLLMGRTASKGDGP